MPAQGHSCQDSFTAQELGELRERVRPPVAPVPRGRGQEEAGAVTSQNRSDEDLPTRGSKGLGRATPTF